MRLKWRRRPFERSRQIKVTALITVLILLLGLGILLDRQIMPIVLQYSKTSAETRITREINEAVTEVLAELQPEYDTLVTLTRDGEENVTSIETDMRRLNQVKARVSTEIADRIGNKEKLLIRIPLGTLFGGDLLAGRGPMISIPVSVSGSVITNIVSHFEAAGVNQTFHRIEMEIYTNVFIAVPTAPTSVKMDTNFIIAESVLLGKVPDSYTSVTGDDRSAQEKIYDFSDEF